MTLGKYLDECHGVLAELRTWHPKGLAAANFSAKSTLPFKVMSHRASLLYRITELAEGAYDLYKVGSLVAAFTLTRSSMETASMMVRLYDIVNIVVKRADVRDLDELLMKGIFGGRDEGARLTAVNILTVVDNTDKRVKGWRTAYDSLSEYVHPNFSGTLSMYAKYDRRKDNVRFGQHMSEKIRQREGLPLLAGALATFKFYFHGTQSLMPCFVSICESRTQKL